jgi:hypothetical protein
LLRVSDVLEFDPERTPPVIFNHRVISKRSIIYWNKDHDINFLIDHANHLLLLGARTPNSIIHKAVLETVASIDAELACCVTLQQEGAFGRGNVKETDRSRYIWPWPSSVSADIREKDDKFTYIEGAFRPNVKNLLGLLSGTALYGSPLATVRELLQNALDAVGEQIAYERLQRDASADSELSLRRLGTVRLQFEYDGDRYWLRCSDNGVGMTKEIIEKHLLISGSGPRPEVRSLERSAKKHSFRVDRTGQFGIGVLSYFMIADRVEITTRRSAEAGDSDATAWRFSTEGIGDFGELGRFSRSARGTEVSLRLIPDVLNGEPVAWFKAVVEFVRSVLRWAPCRIDVRNGISGELVWAAEPGWCWPADDLCEHLAASQFRRFERHDSNDVAKLRSRSERERLNNEKHKRDLFVTRARQYLRLHGPLEVPLNDDVGQARAWIPYFDFPDGASLAYLETDEDGKWLSSPSGQDIFIPSALHMFSWNGFSASAPNRRSLDRSALVIFEVNMVANANIAINRLVLEVKNQEEILSFLEKKLTSLTMKFLEQFDQSRYALLNNVLAYKFDRSIDGLIDINKSSFWKINDLETTLSILKFPLVIMNKEASIILGSEFIKKEAYDIKIIRHI